jgi:hypothetical protein
VRRLGPAVFLSLWRSSELLARLAHDRGDGSEANAHSAALVDGGALCGNPPDDILISGVNIDVITVTLICAIAACTPRPDTQLVGS